MEHAFQQILRHTGRCRQQLRVRSRHGAGKDAGEDQSGDERRTYAVLAEYSSHFQNDGLRCRRRFQRCNCAVCSQRIADNTDQNGNAHGNDHPDRGNAAGNLDLVLVVDRHKAQENVGHTEITQTPRQGGNDAQTAVRDQLAVCCPGTGKAEVILDASRIFHHIIHAAGCVDAVNHQNHQRRSHHDALDQVSKACRQESAQAGVCDNDNGADNHCHMVIPAEQLIEQLAAGRKARCSIRHEEHQNNHSGNSHQHVLVVTIAVGKKVRDGDGVSASLGIHPEPLCHQQPVQISTDGETDRRPAYLRTAAQIRQSRQSHQQIAAHVRCLRTHGRDDGTEPPSSQIKVSDTAVLFGVYHADHDHHCHIHQNSDQNTQN